jgi:glucose-6-phosphate isomerase
VIDMTAPVDPTTTAAWSRLTSAATTLEPDLRAWFATDPTRAQRFSFECADLHVDLSKNLLDRRHPRCPRRLGREVGLAERRDAMLAGERINVTEKAGRCCTPRCVARRTRWARRRRAGRRHDVHEVLDKVYAFADRVRSGDWKGVTGKGSRRSSTSASAARTSGR